MIKLIDKQFKKPTGFYGKIISKIMLHGNRSAYDKIIPELDIKQNDRILEVGYGHGLGISRISSGFDCYVTGIDYSELMFNEATKRNKKYIDNKRVELYFGDFLTSEIIADKYDKVFCINVIYFWDKLEVPFSKIKTGLKEGGSFCIYMVHRDKLGKKRYTTDDIFNKYSIEQVVDSLKLSGFKDISYRLDKGYVIKCKK